MYKKIIFLLLFPIFCLAQGELKITVLDTNKKPIPGVKITISDLNKTFITNESGFYAVAIFDKEHLVIFEKEGFKKIEKILNLNTDFVVQIEKFEQENSIETIKIKKSGNSLTHSKKALNITNLGQKELQKAACCNLSESFETNPSIDVNFADAVSGNKQIKMLGLNSPYILMSEENIPAIRGALQATGLNFIPGPWVESIQITKGAGSVTNGFESVSGQINYELIKPVKEQPFFLNSYASTDGRYELNTNFKNKYSEKLSSLIMLHGSTRNLIKDMNDDGFIDNPTGKQVNFMNRWQYNDAEKGIVSFLNIKYFNDEKSGGTINNTNPLTTWKSNIITDKIEFSNKIGYVFPDMPFQSIGFQQAYQTNSQNAMFGSKLHQIKHSSYFANVLFNSIINNTKNKFITGLNFNHDAFEENLYANFIQNFDRKDTSIGAFFEYAYDNLNNLSFVAGARVDNHNRLGTFFTPRFHLKYVPFENTTLRFSVGRGKRASNIFAENLNILASSRNIIINNSNNGNLYGLNPEIAWNFGASLIQKFFIFGKENEIIVDFYKTDFNNQIVLDYENPQQIVFSNLNGKSFAESLQIEWNISFMNHLNLRTAYKFLNVKTDYSTGLIDKPLQAKHRFFANIAYETHILDKGQQWKFDATFNWIGQQRLPNTTSNPAIYQLASNSPAYNLINTQITRTFSSSFEMYVGIENLGNFKQNNAILAANNPNGANFDSTLIYGPVFGRMFYTGLRFKIKESK